MISKNLKQRLLFGLIGTMIFFLAIYTSYIPILKFIFVFLSIGIIACTLWEYYHLAIQKGSQPQITTGIGCSIAYILAVYLSHISHSWHFVPHLVLFMTLILGFLSYFNLQDNPLNNLAITLFGIAYITIPLSFALKINYFPFPNTFEDGRLWLVYIFTVTKMTDTGAFFFGKNFGKRKLIPHISPKKTVEGALGGLFATIATSLIFYFCFSFGRQDPFLSISFLQSLGLGCLVSFLAQFGDLAESVLKRDAGVKDSSHLPGLGGLLDVADSLVFTLPFMYFILKMNLVG